MGKRVLIATAMIINSSRRDCSWWMRRWKKSSSMSKVSCAVRGCVCWPVCVLCVQRPFFSIWRFSTLKKASQSMRDCSSMCCNERVALLLAASGACIRF